MNLTAIEEGLELVEWGVSMAVLSNKSTETKILGIAVKIRNSTCTMVREGQYGWSLFWKFKKII